ncbi:MAG: hypothetical protein N2483_02730 [Burkholderiaceae bacterium]|nr:hypothetical protein [Burkholderiaceae bacterium]
MQLLHIAPQQVTQLPELPAATAADGFYWLDLTQEELAADEARWLEAIAALTGARLFDLHLRDALNAQQPSFFDRMRDYDVLVFRRLAPSEAPPLAEVDGARGRARRLQEIVTRPVTFFVFDRLYWLRSVTASRARSSKFGSGC